MFIVSLNSFLSFLEYSPFEVYENVKPASYIFLVNFGSLCMHSFPLNKKIPTPPPPFRCNRFQVYIVKDILYLFVLLPYLFSFNTRSFRQELVFLLPLFPVKSNYLIDSSKIIFACYFNSFESDFKPSDTLFSYKKPTFHPEFRK